MSMSARRRGFIIFLMGLFGGVVLLGVTGHVVSATDKRPFCGRCHTMLPAAITHKISSHTNLDCNECHLPRGFVRHYAYKAYYGLHDFAAEHIFDVQLPIKASATMKDVINENCKACHTATNTNVASMEAKPYCTDCHRSVPHARTMPISTRMVAYE